MCISLLGCHIPMLSKMNMVTRQLVQTHPHLFSFEFYWNIVIFTIFLGCSCCVHFLKSAYFTSLACLTAPYKLLLVSFQGSWFLEILRSEAAAKLSFGLTSIVACNLFDHSLHKNASPTFANNQHSQADYQCS